MGEVANTLFAAYPTLEPDELVFVGNPDPTIYKITMAILAIITDITVANPPFYCL